jgi:hypothetical protein
VIKETICWFHGVMPWARAWMKDVRESTTVAGARFLLAASLAPSPHILRHQQNAFDLTGSDVKTFIEASDRKHVI